jgi:hypothetical protein
MVRQRAAERAVDDRLLKATDRRVELLRRNRPLADELIENVGRNRREGTLRGQRFRLRRIGSPHAMPHTRHFGHPP